jgi:hypothetical protein
MRRPTRILLSLAMVGVGTFTLGFGLSAISDPLPPDTTYRPLPTRPLSAVRADDEAQKAQVMARQSELLNLRYDLSNRPAPGVMMSAGRKPVQGGVRVKLPQGATWDGLAQMSPEDINEVCFPPDFCRSPMSSRRPEGRFSPIGRLMPFGARRLATYDGST